MFYSFSFDIRNSTKCLSIGLQVLKLQYEKEQALSHVTVQTKFNYAWGLVKSPRREDQVIGVRLLQGMNFFDTLSSVCSRFFLS